MICIFLLFRSLSFPSTPEQFHSISAPSRNYCLAKKLPKSSTFCYLYYFEIYLWLYFICILQTTRPPPLSSSPALSHHPPAKRHKLYIFIFVTNKCKTQKKKISHKNDHTHTIRAHSFSLPPFRSSFKWSLPTYLTFINSLFKSIQFHNFMNFNRTRKHAVSKKSLLVHFCFSLLLCARYLLTLKR